MSGWQLAAFLGCVVLASSAQSLTGFAMALILLGLCGLFELAPLADVANVASVVALTSAAVALRGHGRRNVDRAMLRSTLLGTVVGVALGVALLGWLSTGFVLGLKLLLGLTVLACAAIMLLRRGTFERRSPPLSFTAIGALAGVLGGLFAASGPPLVYHLYRQPVSAEKARDTLTAVFAFSGSLRLLLVISSGQFSPNALLLCVAAAPTAMAVTWLTRRYPPPLSRDSLMRIVAALLSVTGLGLAIPAAGAIAATMSR